MIKTKKTLWLMALFSLFFFAGFDNLKAEQTSNRHPSYNLMGREAPPADSPLNPNFVVSAEAALEEGGFWRSNYISERLVGLSVDDIDRDGKKEMVYATLRNVYLARVVGEKMQSLANFSLEPTERIISVDTYDIDNDGRKEIIVSSQTDDLKPSAYILSYDGSTLKALDRRIPWYLRAVEINGVKQLIGQKGSTIERGFFVGSPTKVSYSNGKIISEHVMNLPTNINLYDFIIGSLGKDRNIFTAAVKFPSEHINLYEGGDKIWESREEYAGTLNQIIAYSPNDKNPAKIFLPARLLIADIDQDGQNELIIAKNDRGGVPFMSNLRAFSGGVIEAFKYGNLSLSSFFRTRTLPGGAVDIQFGDFNNNGTPDLVVAVVIEKGGGLIENARSIIVAYEVGAAKKPQSKPAKK